MEEFTFGTLATDELKLVHHRTARRGLQHRHALDPLDPAPDQPVTITARLGPDLPADRVACYFTLDGSEPVGSRGVASNGQTVILKQIQVIWDTLVWAYTTCWTATLPAQPEGTVVRYRISAWSDGSSMPETFADWPEVQVTAERAADAFFHGRPLPEMATGDPARGHTFTYHVDRLTPPTWAREAVIYQVFVDRFYPSRGQAWQQTHDLASLCGGTLWGVVEKLDYIAELGANCIWLSPIFPSPSHHGYDATDLHRVAPRLGGDEALRALIDQAHGYGIRVLLDFVCNHVSSQHAIFQDALNKPRSRYRDWFTFDDSTIGYRAFFGSPGMPQINVGNRDARQWLIDAARFWLREYGVDGFRLDYANGPGPDFWSDFWSACKAESPDCFCFGEVVDAPDALRCYAGRMDGCLDFHLGDALRRTYALGRWGEDAFGRFLVRHQAYFPDNFVMPTFLDNHDTDRFLFLAGGDGDALRRAAAVQMRLPGPPIIFYGTEVGLIQRRSTRDGGLHLSREPMVWGHGQDQELLAWYKRLIRERHNASLPGYCSGAPLTPQSWGELSLLPPGLGG